MRNIFSQRLRGRRSNNGLYFVALLTLLLPRAASGAEVSSPDSLDILRLSTLDAVTGVTAEITTCATQDGDNWVIQLKWTNPNPNDLTGHIPIIGTGTDNIDPATPSTYTALFLQGVLDGTADSLQVTLAYDTDTYGDDVPDRQMAVASSDGTDDFFSDAVEITGCGVTVTVPGAPQSLTAEVDQSGDSVILAWAAPSDNGGGDITKYEGEVSVNTEGFGPLFIRSFAPESPVLSDTFPIAEDDSTYIFRVRAGNSAGTGAWSSLTPLTVRGAQPLSAPRNLSATPSGDSAITLTWEAPAELGGYSVLEYYLQDSLPGVRGWGDNAAGSGTFTVLSWSHEGLERGTTTYYRTPASGAGTRAYSPSSTVASATVCAEHGPRVPGEQ